MNIRLLVFTASLAGMPICAGAAPDTLTAFSGNVQIPVGSQTVYQVLLYRGDAAADPNFSSNRRLIASTETDSDGNFVLLAPNLGVDSNVTIRAKNAALRLGGDTVVLKPADAWPDVTSGLRIIPTTQSDPNFGIRSNRYASTTMLFITDRQPAGGDFANTADDVLRAGTFVAHVALGTGQAIAGQCGLASDWTCGGPPVLNDDAYTDALKTTATGAGVGPAVAAALAAAPGKKVLLFVHGYNNTFDQGAGSAARLSYLMEPAPHATIFYSWPSAAKVAGYPQDQKSAELSAYNLVDVLDMLSSGPNPPRVVLAAHSMGSYALTTALYIWALKHPAQQQTFSELILFAGDVDVALWNRRKADISRVVGRIKVYANANDQALAMSECATGDTRLRVGQVIAWSPPVTGFDVTPFASTDGFGHGYLVESTSVAVDWNRWLNASASPVDPLRKTPWLADRGGSWLNTGKLTAATVCALFKKLGV